MEKHLLDGDTSVNKFAETTVGADFVTEAETFTASDGEPNEDDANEVGEAEVAEIEVIEIATQLARVALSGFPHSTSPTPQTSSDPCTTYLASLAKTGRRTMKMRLEQVAFLLTGAKDLGRVPWAQLRFEHVAALRSQLQENGLAPASINVTLYAIRGVCKACWNLSLMSADDYGRIRQVAPVRGSRLPAGRSLASGELVALLEACWRDRSLAGVRDAAIIALLYVGGLRRAEIAFLDIGDYQVTSGALKVRGKGDKERLVYVAGGAGEALDEWLNWRGESGWSEHEMESGGITSTESGGALFCPILKSGRLVRRRLTDQAIYNILKKRALQGGVTHFSPHDLRRTFVGDLLDRGVDIVTVQQLAGHANVSTTAKYDRRGESVKAKAASTLHIPSRRTKPSA